MDPLGTSLTQSSCTVKSEAEKIARLPLIRLRVDHSGFSKVNVQRFGQQFVGVVANAEEHIGLSQTEKSQHKEKYV